MPARVSLARCTSAISSEKYSDSNILSSDPVAIPQYVMVLFGLVLVVLTTAQTAKEEEDIMDVRADEGALAKLDLKDFDPADLFTFELAPKMQMEFFEIIEKAPKTVYVLYLVSSKETNDIDLVVRDPSNKVIRQMLKKKDASFKFRADKTGEYSLVFANRKVIPTQYMEKLTITFAVHVGTSNTGKVLHHEDVSVVESNLMDMHRDLGQFRMEQQISEKQQEAHFQSKG